MAMAKSPENLEHLVPAARGRGSPQSKDNVIHRSARDTSPPQQMLLRRLIIENDWKLFTWLLDTCELASRDERSWKIQRRMLLDAFHKHEETTRGLIKNLHGLTPTQVLEAAISTEADKNGQEEKTNARSTTTS